jgi:hypothetical protein
MTVMADNDIEELDLISAMWILASNDENHLITYEGIRERLGLGPHFDVQGLVLKKRELFRLGAPPGELEDWKTDMKRGSRRPRWVKAMPDEGERLKEIDKFSDDTVFRSQFRANRGSAPSQVEVVTWGLEHIDRIRKGRIASREASAKSWQMWLVFGVALVNIVVTLWLGLRK